jgi:hypothetical protein
MSIPIRGFSEFASFTTLRAGRTPFAPLQARLISSHDSGGRSGINDFSLAVDLLLA